MTAPTINVPLEVSKCLELIRSTDTEAGKYFRQMIILAIEDVVTKAIGKQESGYIVNRDAFVTPEKGKKQEGKK